jgi:protein-L-isoaspartate O-methyltransferase
MYENVRGRAKHVLVVGTPSDDLPISPNAALAPDGMLIVMESDTTRAAELRARFSSEGLGNRATVIGGHPARMLYKLGGPFDVIFCSDAYISVRPLLEKLLATDGVLIPLRQSAKRGGGTNGKP